MSHCTFDRFSSTIEIITDKDMFPARDPKPVSQGLGKHTCVKWDSIFDWMKENSFDPFEPGILMHPIFGKL